MKMSALSADVLFHGFGDSGAPTLQEPDMTPVTLQPVTSLAGTAPRNCPTGGDWNLWCDCMYPAAMDPTNNARCRATPLGPALSFAPWTIAGRVLRGLSASAPVGGTSVIASAITVGSSAPTSAPALAGQGGIFGLPKTIALVGGGLAVVGMLGTAVFVKKAKRKQAASPRPTQAPAMAGYRRRRRR